MKKTGSRAAVVRFLSAVARGISKALPITAESGIQIKVKKPEGWEAVDTGQESVTFAELDEKYGSGNWALSSRQKES